MGVVQLPEEPGIASTGVSRVRGLRVRWLIDLYEEGLQLTQKKQVSL